MQPENQGLENISFDSVSNYKVVKEIARGGMGIIFLAEKNTGGILDHVVLKSLRSINPEEEKKFKEEAEIATHLRHENIVKTYGLELASMSKLPEDFRKLIHQENTSLEKEAPPLSFFEKLIGKKSQKEPEEKNLLMLIMDYIKGTDLYTILVRHIQKNLLFPVPLAAFIIARIATALSYAHTYIVHRDISPENILISEQGVCKLTDFGIAVLAHQQPDYWAGKLLYMAPEQIRGEKLDERADIFALGVVAYQAITGISLLYAAPNLEFEEQIRIVSNQIETSVVLPHLVRKDVPLELSRIIGKMLSPLPEYRYQRASAIVNDLEKEYLYAKGFGPTNNSLASYIDIFNSDFEEYNEEELQQLSFLKDSKGELCLKRTLDVEGFTKIGQRMLAERKGSLIVNQLRRIHKDKKESVVVPTAESPIIKVKYLDNVIEGFNLLEQNEVTVGRSAKNTIVLPERIVSAHHASFFLRNQSPILEDNASNNGTIINGAKATRASLKEGDKIQIGSTLLYFLWEKQKSTNENIVNISLEKPMPLKNLPQDFTLEFLPSEEILTHINDITEAFLQDTPLGIMKKNIMVPAVYEAVRMFSGESDANPIQLRYYLSKKYISFRCVSPKNSNGYEVFLNSIVKRMDNTIDPRTSLEPQELAVSLILKVFERIEMMRFSREIEMKNFF